MYTVITYISTTVNEPHTAYAAKSEKILIFVIETVTSIQSFIL